MTSIADGKEGNANQDCETTTHNMAIRMGVAVHCHDCWKHTDLVNYQRDLVRLAVDVIQTSGITGKECFIEANTFLTNEFRNGAKLL